MNRHLVAADELRDEYERRKRTGTIPRAGWKDAIRYLEWLSMPEGKRGKKFWSHVRPRRKGPSLPQERRGPRG